LIASAEEPVTRLERSTRLAALAAVVLALFLYLGRLGSFPILRGNEAMYAYPPIRMLETGDFLVPHYEGGPFLEKPPLVWWIVAASYRIFGISVFAARLPSALAGLLTALLVGLWARRRAGPEAGALAPLILLFSLQFYFFAVTFAADAFLTLAVTAAVLSLDAACRRRGGSDAARGAAAGCALAAAFYFKGLVGIVLPAGAVALGLLLDRERPIRPRARGAWAAGCLLALLAPWHWAMQQRLGPEFWRAFYWKNQFLRGATSLYARPRSPFYYLAALAWSVFPWSVLSLAALRRGRRSSVPLGWLAFGLVFWSSLVMKREVYVMTLFPAIALLVAENESDASGRARTLRRFVWWSGAGACVVAALLCLRGIAGLAALAGFAPAALLVLGVLALAAALAAGARVPEASLPPYLAALACGVVLAAVQSVEASLGRRDPIPPWGERIRAECARGCDGFLYGVNAYSIDFYSRLDWRWVADPLREVPLLLRHETGYLVLWSDLEPTLNRLPFSWEVMERRPALVGHWAATLLAPSRGAWRSLSLVRVRRISSGAPHPAPDLQSGGAASAAGGPDASVLQATAPSTTAPPANE